VYFISTTSRDFFLSGTERTSGISACQAADLVLGYGLEHE
jgi:hypothetical protein